jgi:hypothetical protein
VGGRSGGRLGGNADPNGDRTDCRFLSLTLLFTLGIFFVLRRFVNLDLLETNNVYRCKANLEIPVGKLRGTT